MCRNTISIMVLLRSVQACGLLVISCRYLCLVQSTNTNKHKIAGNMNMFMFAFFLLIIVRLRNLSTILLQYAISTQDFLAFLCLHANASQV
jgi:hypothetical protein